MDLNEHDLLQMEEYSSRLPQILQREIDLENCENAAERLKSIIGLFFGVYAYGVDFKFPPGDKKLLIAIGAVVRGKCSEGGLSYFQSESDCSECQIVSTPFGKLYGNNSLEIERKQKKKSKLNTTESNEIAEESSPTLQTNPDTELIHELVKYLQEGLSMKLKEQVNHLISQSADENSPALQADIIEVDFDSVVSLLKLNGIIRSDNLQANESKRSASATIKCFCSVPASVIKVFFMLKNTTKEKILCILDTNFDEKSSLDVDLITAHFGRCWSLSNFISHAKNVHSKLYRLNGE